MTSEHGVVVEHVHRLAVLARENVLQRREMLPELHVYTAIRNKYQTFKEDLEKAKRLDVEEGKMSKGEGRVPALPFDEVQQLVGRPLVNVMQDVLVVGL